MICALWLMSFFFFMIWPSPRPTLFPYTTLFRSAALIRELPGAGRGSAGLQSRAVRNAQSLACARARDRKSTRLNSSHEWISYAVFCLKKKREDKQSPPLTACPVTLPCRLHLLLS